MSSASLFTPWIDRECSVVVREEHCWRFEFSDAGKVSISCPWRIIAAGAIALTDADHGQRFGLPEPIDASIRARELLADRRVQDVSVADVSGDLKVHFSGNVALELFHNSSGYEVWHAVIGSDGSSVAVIACGGGDLAIF